MPLKLNQIPGWADIPDFVLAAEKRAMGAHINRISNNAAYGMVRLEVFTGFYHDGDTVILPQSPIDGYNYSRDELTYIWSVQQTANPSSGWASATGGQSLWYTNWKVAQADGLVTSEEWYIDSSKKTAASKDGTLLVFTIGQRQKSTILISAPPTYVNHDNSEIVVDEPLNQSLIQDLNRNSKFSVLDTEVIYMGEWINGTTIPNPVSPVDGHVYLYSAVKFIGCWRWSTVNNAFVTPDLALLQLQDLNYIIDSTGHVSVEVFFKPDGAVVGLTGYGRIAVFALCRRAGGPGAPPTDFTEIDLNLFVPGVPLRAADLAVVNDNIKIACNSPEFFGPTRYTNAQTVPLPVSPLDGYVYSRDELHYIYDWGSTSLPNPPFSTNVRILGLFSYVDISTGFVTIFNWRLGDDGVLVTTVDGQLNVIVLAQRKAQHPELIAPVAPDVPANLPGAGTGGATTATYFVNGVPVSTDFLVEVNTTEVQVNGA